MKTIDLASLQHTRFRLDFEILIIEQNDMERALLFRRYYALDDCLKDFLEENGSKEMKKLFSLPQVEMKITSEKEAIARGKTILMTTRDSFSFCNVRHDGLEDYLGWLSNDESRKKVFITLFGLMRHGAHWDFELLQKFS